MNVTKSLTIKSCVPVVLLILVTILTGCNLPSDATPTAALNSTQAYQTVQARLTEAVALTPTFTPEPSNTPFPTATETQPPAATAEATQTATSTPTATRGASCDQASPGNPIDVTIQDDTEMNPGESFSKTWRLRNSGTCSWTSEYSVVWFSGERMNAAASVSLDGPVAPGETVDVTVDMTAPSTSGTFQSNWKLRNASGVLFGIGSGDGLPFYVRIVVRNAPTSTATGQPSVTPTATPGAQAAGSATMLLDDQIDLDSNQVNGGDVFDLSYEFVSADDKHYLIPENGASLAVYGGFKPGLSECQKAILGTLGVNVDDLAIGTYICTQTNAERYGYVRLIGFDTNTFRIDLEVYTWQLP